MQTKKEGCHCFTSGIDPPGALTFATWGFNLAMNARSGERDENLLIMPAAAKPRPRLAIAIFSWGVTKNKKKPFLLLICQLRPFPASETAGPWRRRRGGLEDPAERPASHPKPL